MARCSRSTPHGFLVADQGRWFKLWAEALNDPNLGNMSIADFGRWAKFGTYLKVHGTDGSVHLQSPARLVCMMLEVPSFDALLTCFLSFPNCEISRDDCARHCAGECVTVTWRNWRKYQIDSSAERQRRYRHRQAFGVTTKKRGEERRREKKRGDPVAAPIEVTGNGHGPVVFKIPASVVTALDKCSTLGAVTRLRNPQWWQAEVRANSGVHFDQEVYKAEAWLRTHREKHYTKLDAFLHNWLGRADREPETE